MLYKVITNIVKPYIGITTDMFLEKLAKQHLGKPFNTIAREDIDTFVPKVEKAAKDLLNSAAKATEIRDKILELKKRLFFK